MVSMQLQLPLCVAEAKIKNGDVEDRKRSYLGGTAN